MEFRGIRYTIRTGIERGRLFVVNWGRAQAGCTPGMASTKLAGMYDVYRHLKLTPYRAIIPKDVPFPSERHAQNWRKVGTIQTVSPEAKKQIDQNGFCIYIFTPTLSFDEIEGANPNI
jgi:hypothetical protein